jgi:flagellar hook-associated protein 1 FlgK
MGNLFTTLLNTTGTLRVYSRVFNVVQNNISNANTPGYVKQDQSVVALPFDPSSGLTGGVLPGAMLSARSEYLEQSVRNQQELFGSAKQKATDLGQVEPLFDLSSDFGIPGSLSKFFNSFSTLSVNPNDAVSRQSVIDIAAQVAQDFHLAADGVNQVSVNADSQTLDAVASVNRLAAQIVSINQRYRSSADASVDAGLDAQLHAALEELSGIANFTIIKTPDGAANIYLGGQAPLVIGDHLFQIQADLSGGQTVIRDSQSNDITSQIQRGSLGALISEKNTNLPGYLADLNTLAQSFADSINSALGLGLDKNGAVPTQNLFSYNQPEDAASTLAVTDISPDQIAAALPSAPGGNGNAIAIAQLADAPTVGAFTFAQFYGQLGARVGRDVAAARQDQSQYQDSVTQAQARRKDQTGVSLDEEAAKILQFQQAYQAVGKVVDVLNTLTDTLLNMVQ